MIILAGLVGLGASCGLFAWLVGLERRGRGYVMVGLCTGLLLVEAALFPNQGIVSSSLFYPQLKGQNFRLVEILIPLALAARWWAIPPQTRLRPTGLAWAAFFAWYAALAIVGTVSHNPSHAVLFDAKAIVYVGGGYLLVAGVDPSWLVSERIVKRVILCLGALVWTAAALTVTHVGIPIHVPLIRSDGPSLSADLSSCSTALALCLLGVEICRRPLRKSLVGACVVILLCPLAGTQRAAIVEMAFGIAFLALAAVTVTRRQISVKRSDFTFVLGSLVALAVVVVMYRSLIGQSINPLARGLHETFNGVGKQQSAAARVGLRRQAYDLIGHRPVLGWGLGKQVRLVPLPPELPVNVPSHNLALDLLIRGGVVALALFALGVVRTLIDGFRAMASQPDNLLAGLALGATAAIVGFLAKSSVESLFDQFRLATMFGFMLGTVAMASKSIVSKTPTLGPASPGAVPGQRNWGGPA